MKESTKNKFPFLNICFKPEADVRPTKNGRTGSRRKKKRSTDIFVPEEEEDVPDNNSDSKPSRHRKNRSLSCVLKAVMFSTALTRRIRRRKSSNRKSGSEHTTEQPSPVLADANEFTPGGPHAVSSSLPSESKRTDYTVFYDELISDCGSELTGSTLMSHGSSTSDQESELIVLDLAAQKRLQPQKIVVVTCSVLNNRGIHVILTVVGVTVAWGKACAILFTSMWLCSIFFIRLAGRRRSRAWPVN